MGIFLNLNILDVRRIFLVVFLAASVGGRGQGPRVLGQQTAAHQFVLGDSSFLLDGKPFLMISGEMHYTRVPREAWRQRMRMARAMGLNTVGTYVFWNVHEPEKGKFDFSGNNDIAAFVRTAKEEGLWVVLRPSPYVCAEWEFGGYPYWLEKEAGLVVRSKEPKYLEEYRRYIREVGRQLAPLQVNNGGNILMVQIENEYGSYGNDKEYLDLNRQLFMEAGFDGLLYTCDPAGDLEKGYLPGLLPAVNGVDRPERVKEIVRRHHGGKGPYYIAEWYPAWFDWWGTRHHLVAADQYAGRLDSVLGAGISINMYMFHGGTTRGFMNGANANDRNPYEPQISSYDYDAPLDEAGNPTPKFLAFRRVIQKHLPPGIVLPDVPASKPAVNTSAVRFTEPSSLFDILPLPVTSEEPLTFEDLGQAYGYVLYRTEIDAGGSALLRLPGLRDFAVDFVNGQRAGVLDRCKAQDSLALKLPVGRVRLDILVENLGRVNFGPYLLHNLKGITGQVLLSGRALRGWQMYRLPFDHPDSSGVRRQASIVRRQTGNGTGVPVIRKGILTLGHPADTYLDMTNWGKGCIWVNGHNLGRYWNVGPQQTVYVPAEWLHAGDNEIAVFEILKPGVQELRGIDHPILDRLNKQ